jgi:hypothetical protein
VVEKAGMENCDMDAIAKKIHEISKDSDHYVR